MVLKEKPKSDDIVESSIGAFGCWHFWVIGIIFLSKFGVGWHQLSIIFLAPISQTYKCVNESIDVCDPDCPEVIFDRSIFEETIVSQWGLICNYHFLAALTQSISMLGILIGSMFFGWLADKAGRRTSIVLAVLLQGLTGVSASYVPWFSAFVVLKFFLTVATGGLLVVTFVLIVELVGLKYRSIIGILYQLPFNIGNCTLPVFSYFLRDWRHYHAALSLPSFILWIYICLLPESPRYLMANGKKEKAIKLLTKAAKQNNYPTDDIAPNVDKFVAALEGSQKKKANCGDLCRTKVIRLNTWCINYNWFIMGFCFYGLSQYVTALGGDIFLNTIFSGAVQIPATILSIWTAKGLGRRGSLMLTHSIGGASVIALAFVPKDPTYIQGIIAAVGVFGFAAGFPVVYIYAGEIFPTTLRSIGVGTCSMTARIGAMIAPFVAYIKNKYIPPLIFGAVAIVGVFVTIFMPETLDCKLPSTVEEAEEFTRKNKEERKERKEQKKREKAERKAAKQA